MAGVGSFRLKVDSADVHLSFVKPVRKISKHGKTVTTHVESKVN